MIRAPIIKSRSRTSEEDLKGLKVMLRDLLVLIMITLVLFSEIIGLMIVPDRAMEPRLSPGDLILYYRLDKDADLRDVVVLKKEGREYIGRIIASGGDKVDITEDNGLMVNDLRVFEEDIYQASLLNMGDTEYPVFLGEDECFVLCDRRDHGEDSRSYGPVKRSEIKGTVIGVYRRRGI